jgi:hypothetical protein
MRFIAIPILLLALLQGCAGPAASPASLRKASGEVQLKAVLVDDKFQEIAAPYPRKLKASFPLVLGAVFGNPSQRVGYEPPAVLGEKFTLDLDSLEVAARNAAAPVQGMLLASSMSVQPSQLKVARVGTYFLDETGAYSVSGAGFADARSHEPLVLVYFDRAATIKGHAQSWGENFDFDVAVPEAGLYWLRARKVGVKANQVLVSEPPADLLMFALGMTP